jgi:hypothetical protein
MLEVVNRARRRREVQHSIEWTGDVGVRRDVVSQKREPVMAGEVRNIVRIPGDEVVQPHHMVTVAEEAVGQVRAQESGGTGNEDSHAVDLPNER